MPNPAKWNAKLYGFVGIQSVISKLGLLIYTLEETGINEKQYNVTISDDCIFMYFKCVQGSMLSTFKMWTHLFAFCSAVL